MRIPLTTQLKDLLQEIKATADSDWVLPSKKSSSGHLEDPKRPWQDLLARAGIENLRLHDLRRTQGSYQAITGASLHIVGRSLGHKSASATQVYARLTTDPIKESMQKATDRMMELVGL
jgi:integrase